MKSIGASSEEMKLIRDLDRQSQGITTEQEESGCAALLHAQLMLGGRLAVVDLPHSRSASVTDANVREFGGPGYENLLIRSPCSTQFFGSGRAIAFLKSAIPGGWSGGSLPEFGFWGHEPAIHDEALKVIMNSMTTLPSFEIPVQVFHHTVVWPLLLRGEPVGDGPELDRWVEVFERQKWIDRTELTSLETTHDLFSREQSNGFTSSRSSTFIRLCETSGSATARSY